MSHETKEWYKIWRKTDLLFQKWQEFAELLPEYSKFSKFLLRLIPFMESIKFGLKKVQRSYLSWHWRVMQNLKKNWLVVWKTTTETWLIFIRTMENVKIGILMGSFCPKYKLPELQTYIGVISNETEEWWKI